MSYPDSSPFGVLEQNALIYLVTGRHPNSIQDRPVLRQDQRLSPVQALEEIRGLNDNQLRSLGKLFAYGLTGDLLRTFVGSEFTVVHQLTLEHLIRDSNPPLSAPQAMLRIQDLPENQALGRQRTGIIEESFGENEETKDRAENSSTSIGQGNEIIDRLFPSLNSVRPRRGMSVGETLMSSHTTLSSPQVSSSDETCHSEFTRFRLGDLLASPSIDQTPLVRVHLPNSADSVDDYYSRLGDTHQPTNLTRAATFSAVGL